MDTLLKHFSYFSWWSELKWRRSLENTNKMRIFGRHSRLPLAVPSSYGWHCQHGESCHWSHSHWGSSWHSQPSCGPGTHRSQSPWNVQSHDPEQFCNMTRTFHVKKASSHRKHTWKIYILGERVITWMRWPGRPRWRCPSTGPRWRHRECFQLKYAMKKHVSCNRNPIKRIKQYAYRKLKPFWMFFGWEERTAKKRIRERAKTNRSSQANHAKRNCKKIFLPGFTAGLRWLPSIPTPLPWDILLHFKYFQPLLLFLKTWYSSQKLSFGLINPIKWF